MHSDTDVQSKDQGVGAMRRRLHLPADRLASSSVKLDSLWSIRDPKPSTARGDRRAEMRVGAAS